MQWLGISKYIKIISKIKERQHQNPPFDHILGMKFQKTGKKKKVH
jgi:hypothetical protein